MNHCLFYLMLLLFVAGCRSSGGPENDPSKIRNSTLSEKERAENEISVAPQRITSVHIPDVVTFAGDTFPIERSDVREALESELMINTFRHSHTLAIIKNVLRWKTFVIQILQSSDIPADFLYLAVVESEFDNNACSYAGAMGMWQIMAKTAKDYNLKINRDVDMRRDPKLSTEAAGKFLRRAYANLNNWTLAAASYNVGVKGMKVRLSEQKVNNFFDLHLNAETARYVYRIIAFKLILENPEAYGYHVSEEEKYAPYRFSTITVSKDIPNLVDFAKKYNTTYKELRLLNPWFNNTDNFKLGMKKKESYEIRVPLNTTAGNQQ
jgi:membrane-bound lytic murein transglycosylase D